MACQVHPRAASPGPQIGQVEFAVLDLEVRAGCRSPLDGRHARQHLVEIEGLDEVVVRTRFEPADAVADLVARGHHQHRQTQSRSAPLAQQPECITVRQLKVQHRKIRGSGLPGLCNQLAPVHLVAGSLQVVGDRLSQVDVVFKQQHVHGRDHGGYRDADWSPAD